MPDPDNQPGYDLLREQVESILVEARHERALADDSGKLRAYWHIGDAVTRHLDERTDPTYGQNVVANLSKDINLGTTTLYDILRYRRLVPTFGALGELSWSHYITLIHLPDAEQFSYYEQLAADGAWTTRQLKQAVDADRGGQLFAIDTDRPVTPLRARFGELYTHRVVADPLHPDGPPVIDFGFYSMWVPHGLPGFEAARPGDIVSLRPDADGVTRAHVRSDRPRLWTYVAHVQRVIDGDSLAVVVDLGLGHRAFPRLRLRGIDCPEIYTRAGRRARDFVSGVLSAVDRIVISTWTTDVYGRYLADVKYLPAADAQQVLENGTYLNRQLIDRGLALRYQ